MGIDLDLAMHSGSKVLHMIIQCVNVKHNLNTFYLKNLIGSIDFDLNFLEIFRFSLFGLHIGIETGKNYPNW